MIVLIIR